MIVFINFRCVINTQMFICPVLRSYHADYCCRRMQIFQLLVKILMQLLYQESSMLSISDVAFGGALKRNTIIWRRRLQLPDVGHVVACRGSLRVIYASKQVYAHFQKFWREETLQLFIVNFILFLVVKKLCKLVMI